MALTQDTFIITEPNKYELKTYTFTPKLAISEMVIGRRDESL
jgi:hypothetical protein